MNKDAVIYERTVTLFLVIFCGIRASVEWKNMAKKPREIVQNLLRAGNLFPLLSVMCLAARRSVLLIRSPFTEQ